MATRTIADRRDRLTTILVAPLMSCSARLPVYILLIGTFVPAVYLFGTDWFGVRGLVMFAMYLLGIVFAVIAATVIKRVMLKGPTPAFLMEMPPYRVPMLRTVLGRLWERGRAFVVRAGTIILLASIVIWALTYFPRSDEAAAAFEAQRETATATLPDGDDRKAALGEIDNREAAAQLEGSAFGYIGKAVEPLFVPLGWDWRISAATIASIPAREVVVATMGITFGRGDVDMEDEQQASGMQAALTAATWPDGRPLFTLASALSVVVFFALCLQCMATVATIRREANSWGWAIFAWVYMTSLAWIAAMITYQVTTAVTG